MKTVKYRLYSNESIELDIPEEYATVAERVAREVLDGKIKELAFEDSTNHLFRNPGILTSASRLSSLRDEKSTDELYLRICQKLNESHLEDSDNKFARTLDHEIIETIYTLR